MKRPAGELEQLCRERGIRMRSRGGAVLQVMDQALDHPCVEEIYRRAVLIDVGVSLATVYRTVSDLADANLLTRLELGDGKTRFEKSSVARHDHLVDMNTGAILEFANPEIETAIRAAAAALGYNLVSYRLKVLGESEAASDTPEGITGKVTMLPRGRR